MQLTCTRLTHDTHARVQTTIPDTLGASHARPALDTSVLRLHLTSAAPLFDAPLSVCHHRSHHALYASCFRLGLACGVAASPCCQPVTCS